MKKIYLPLFLITMIVILIGIIIYQSDIESNILTKFSEYIHVIAIGILFLFGAFIAFRRFRSSVKGLPAEDELSKKIERKASSKAFFVSLFLWLIITYIQNESKQNSDIFFGYGIIGMALLFAIFYVYYSIKGNINE